MSESIIRLHQQFEMTHALNKFLLFFSTLLLTCCGNENIPSPYHAIDISWQHPNADFQLTDFNGKPSSLNTYKGKVVVLFFGYTHCPEVCPTTLADLAQTLRILGTDASRVQVVFATLDPERDTPDLLAKFAPAFDPSFIAVYGDTSTTSKAAASFGVKYEKQSDKSGSYTIDHSDGIYLIGTNGQPLLLAPYGQPANLLAEDIRLLLSIGR